MGVVVELKRSLFADVTFSEEILFCLAVFGTDSHVLGVHASELTGHA